MLPPAEPSVTEWSCEPGCPVGPDHWNHVPVDQALAHADTPDEWLHRLEPGRHTASFDGTAPMQRIVRTSQAVGVLARTPDTPHAAELISRAVNGAPAWGDGIASDELVAWLTAQPLDGNGLVSLVGSAGGRLDPEAIVSHPACDRHTAARIVWTCSRYRFTAGMTTIAARIEETWGPVVKTAWLLGDRLIAADDLFAGGTDVADTALRVWDTWGSAGVAAVNVTMNSIDAHPGTVRVRELDALIEEHASLFT